MSPGSVYSASHVGRNKPVRAQARTGVSGTPLPGFAGNAHPALRLGGLIPAYAEHVPALQCFEDSP